jgi:hypothetical protein
MTPAPRSTPLQPYSPKVPVLGGMNGCQFSVWMNMAPAPITIITIATLITTITAFTVADSLMPTISSIVTRIVMITAGTLKTATVVGAIAPPASCTIVPGAALHFAGNCSPSWCSSVTRLPDQPTATVAAPRAYSRIRSQPMIHAMNSPSVA